MTDTQCGRADLLEFSIPSVADWAKAGAGTGMGGRSRTVSGTSATAGNTEMISKVLAVLSLVCLPVSVAFWHRSHARPMRYRFDLTLYKSLDVFLKDGVCGMHVLSMPTRTASRTDFLAPLSYDPTPNRASLLLSTSQSGPYRNTWVVFPFWLSTGLLIVMGATPIFRGPMTLWWRRRTGRCTACGYNLTGNRSGRCPECGNRVETLRSRSTGASARHR